MLAKISLETVSVCVFDLYVRYVPSPRGWESKACDAGSAHAAPRPRPKGRGTHGLAPPSS